MHSISGASGNEMNFKMCCINSLLVLYYYKPLSVIMNGMLASLAFSPWTKV